MNVGLMLPNVGGLGRCFVRAPKELSIHLKHLSKIRKFGFIITLSILKVSNEFFLQFLQKKILKKFNRLKDTDNKMEFRTKKLGVFSQAKL